MAAFVLLVLVRVSLAGSNPDHESEITRSFPARSHRDEALALRYFIDGVEADMNNKSVPFKWMKMYATYFSGALDDEIKLLDISLPDTESNFTKDFTVGSLHLTEGFVDPLLKFQFRDGKVSLKPQEKAVITTIIYIIPTIVFGFRFRYFYADSSIKGNFVIKLEQQSANMSFMAVEPSYRRCDLKSYQIVVNVDTSDLNGKHRYGISFQETEDKGYQSTLEGKAAMKIINALVQQPTIMETVKRAVYDVITMKLPAVVDVTSEAFLRKNNVRICATMLNLLTDKNGDNPADIRMITTNKPKHQ